MIKQYSDFSDDELDILVGLAQKWEQRNFADSVVYGPYWVNSEKEVLLPVEGYQPTYNGGQAMWLVKEFKVDFYQSRDEEGFYYAIVEQAFRYKAPTPERAIRLAVVASTFSVSECVELLKEVA